MPTAVGKPPPMFSKPNGDSTDKWVYRAAASTRVYPGALAEPNENFKCTGAPGGTFVTGALSPGTPGGAVCPDNTSATNVPPTKTIPILLPITSSPFVFISVHLWLIYPSSRRSSRRARPLRIQLRIHRQPKILQPIRL